MQETWPWEGLDQMEPAASYKKFYWKKSLTVYLVLDLKDITFKSS